MPDATGGAGQQRARGVLHQGCYQSFYLHRCRVCEVRVERTTANRKICKRSKCRNALAAGSGFGRFFEKPSQASQNLERTQKTTAAQAVLSAGKPSRPWFVVAGPPLTASQLHCATIPDGPDGQWKGGELERIETKNRKLLEERFAALDSTATNNCATCGAGEDPVDHKPDRNRPERTVTLCRPCWDKRHAARIVTGAKAAAIPDDLSIPVFLRRIND